MSALVISLSSEAAVLQSPARAEEIQTSNNEGDDGDVRENGPGRLV